MNPTLCCLSCGLFIGQIREIYNKLKKNEIPKFFADNPVLCGQCITHIMSDYEAPINK